MMARLGELGEIITGNTPKTSEPENYASDDICFVKPSDISDGNITKITHSEFHISEHAREKARILPPGSVLVTCICIIGKIAINSVECACNQQINAIVPDYGKCTSEYLAYALLSRKRQLQSMANAPVVPIINKSQFSDIIIPTPTISQQKYISATLEKVSGLIYQHKQQFVKLNELIKSRFVEMFGEPIQNPLKWPQVQLSEVIRKKASNGYFAKREEYTNTGNASVLGVANVVNRMYSQCDGLPKTNLTDDNIKKYKLQYGDVLFCRSSLVAEGIGKASIVPKDVPNNTVFECHVIRVPLNTDICVPEFIQVLTTTDYYRHQVLRHAKTATMTTISQDGILNTNIILPPIHIQELFYTFVSQVEKTKAAVQSALDKAQLLFDSLMQKYFG